MGLLISALPALPYWRNTLYRAEQGDRGIFECCTAYHVQKQKANGRNSTERMGLLIDELQLARFQHRDQNKQYGEGTGIQHRDI